MLHHVALVRTDILEERIASIIRVTRIGDLGTTLAATSNRSTVRRNISSQRASVASYSDSCHPDDVGDTFLRNVGSYKSHME
jgi:hypothetical protein